MTNIHVRVEAKFIYRYIDSKDSKDSVKVRSEYIANTYYSNYKPSKSTLKKHGILKK